MYLHILIGILAFTFCSGDSSNQAISSVNFHRDDVPLSYQYSYFHIYTTEKPNSQTNPKAYKNIQYAPLVFNPNDSNNNNYLYNKAPISKWNRKQNITKNEYLEPQVHNAGINFDNRQYIAGYNIETPKLRNIDYNKINLEYKEIAMPDQKINNLIIHPNAESIKNPKHDSSQTSNNLHAIDTRQHIDNPRKSHQVPSESKNAQIHPVFNSHIKVPRLHLNVARAYNFARLPADSPSNGNKNILRIHNKQSYARQIKTPTIQKTFLFPRADKKH